MPKHRETAQPLQTSLFLGAVTHQLIAALCFSLILNLPSVIYCLRFGVNSASTINHDDEVVYLQQAKFASELRPAEAFYSEHSNETSLFSVLSQTPQAITTFLIGKIGHVTGATPNAIGFFSDLLCAALAFWVFYNLFFLICGSGWASVIGTVTFLVPINLFWVPSLLQAQFLGANILSAYEPLNMSTIQRGLNTQWSYILLGLTLIEAVRSSQALCKRRSFLLMGIYSGILIYTYFFTWVAALYFIAVLITWRFITVPSVHPQFIFEFAFSHIATITPAIVLIAFGAQPYSLALPEVDKYWYFSPLGAVAAFSCFVLSRFSRLGTQTRMTCFLCGGCYLGDLILLNIQPALGIAIQPLHFVNFYLSPLSSGLFATLVCCSRSSIFCFFPSKQIQKFLYIFFLHFTSHNLGATSRTCRY